VTIKNGGWLVLAQIGEEPIRDLPNSKNIPTIPVVKKTPEQQNYSASALLHPTSSWAVLSGRRELFYQLATAEGRIYRPRQTN